MSEAKDLVIFYFLTSLKYFIRILNPSNELNFQKLLIYLCLYSYRDR